MPHERPSDVFRQCAREGAVDQAGDLGDDHVVGSRSELVAGGPRRSPCGEEREPACGRGEARSVLVLGGLHDLPVRRSRLQPLREELERLLRLGLLLAGEVDASLSQERSRLGGNLERL